MWLWLYQTFDSPLHWVTPVICGTTNGPIALSIKLQQGHQGVEQVSMEQFYLMWNVQVNLDLSHQVVIYQELSSKANKGDVLLVTVLCTFFREWAKISVCVSGGRGYVFLHFYCTQSYLTIMASGHCPFLIWRMKDYTVIMNLGRFLHLHLGNFPQHRASLVRSNYYLHFQSDTN